MSGQRRADRLAPAGQQRQQLGVQPRLEEQAYGLGGDQRRLLRRLGQHRVSGGQGGGDLAGEDGQREIPGADAGEHAPAPQLQRVGFADRSLQHLGRAELLLGQHGVVAAEVGRLAHLRHRVRQGLARLRGEQGHQAVGVGLQRVAHGAQHPRPLGAAETVPGRLGAAGQLEGAVDVGRARLGRLAQHAGEVGGAAHRLPLYAGRELAAHDRPGG